MTNKLFRLLTLGITLTCTVLQSNAQDVHLEWVRQIGGSCWDGDEDDAAQSITTDGSGNVYTTGYFCGTVDFDPGPATSYITSASAYGPDLYIYKLNPIGHLVWIKTIPTNAGSGSKSAIAVDSLGTVYTTGSYSGTVDFNPGADSFKLEQNGAFVLKLDTSGDFLWAKAFYQASAIDIAIDTSGNVFSTGRFSSTVDFDPGTGPADTLFVTSQGAADIYISKLNPAGDLSWLKSFGADEDDWPASITTDVSGNVLTTGSFKDTVDFDPGAGTAHLIATGYQDAFISKLDNSGNFIWIKGFLADGSLDQYAGVYSAAICTDASGNVYTKGAFGGTVDFDPGILSNNLVTPGANERYVFISKLDNLGNFVWVKKTQSGWGVGDGGGIAVDNFDNVYTTGTFEGTSDFDPGSGVFNLIAGNYDVYISKLTVDGDFVWAKNLGGYAYDRGYDITVDPTGKNIYTVGSFAAINGGQADFDPGADTLILTAAGNSDGFIHKLSCNTYGTLTVTACDSFTTNGTTYLESGTYITQMISNAIGCDSIISIDLTLTHSTSSTITETACKSFVLNGQTYTTSGTYLQTLPNAIGCDSLLLLELTINDINTTVIQNGSTLSAVVTDATYQWIKCDNGNMPISGATQKNYTATSEGSYALIITKNGCSDTSVCYDILATGIDDSEANNFAHVYPNPVHTELMITTLKKYRHATIKLFNIVGQLMTKQTKVSGDSYTLDLSIYPPGTYILEIEADGDYARSKIIKE